MKILTLTAALVLSAFAWAGAPNTAPAQKRTPAKKPTTIAAVGKKAPARAPSKATVAGKPAKKVLATRFAWRNRQSAPTADRYKEIQDALVARGYLSLADANGTWGTSSTEALKKFQAEQTLGSTGKINSLSLIALGLGPKYDGSVPRVVDGNLVAQPAEYGRN
jgi:Putative peptidoglycan binding domain